MGGISVRVQERDDIVTIWDIFLYLQVMKWAVSV